MSNIETNKTHTKLLYRDENTEIKLFHSTFVDFIQQRSSMWKDRIEPDISLIWDSIWNSETERNSADNTQRIIIMYPASCRI